MENYNKFFENKKILYHSTSKENVANILKNGLKLDASGFIYLSEKPIKTSFLTSTFEVNIPKISELMDWRDVWGHDPSEWESDMEYDYRNPYWVYLQPIPPRYLKLINE